ncbi:unnamed protein product [Rhizophagus irregularis]|nr:unnamed protein product [Rhizophagus irregularis]
MKSLYQVIEEGKVGIFESPTGTGKSLQYNYVELLKWLKDNEERYSSSNHVNTTWTGNPNEYSKNKKRQEDLIKEIMTWKSIWWKNIKVDDDSENHEENDNMSAQVRELLNKGKSLENFDDNKDAREFEEGEPDEIKIYYCSRTHSQLTIR